MTRMVLGTLFILFIGLALEGPGAAQDITRLQTGVVKITAKPPEGTANVGTGFIVRVEKEAVYVVTAAHVVVGDQQPRVEFFTKRNLPIPAEVLGLEGGDEVRGLALLVVRGAQNLPTGLTALSLAGTARLTGGEDIMVIGFPRNAGPWAIVKGNISSRQGRDLFFSPSVESGHSGGPIFQSGKVVGVVGAGSQSVGRGVTVGSVEDYLDGFGVTSQAGGGSSSSVASVPPSPAPPTAQAKSESRPPTNEREITGKDGAPMVLIPAGEFWMGSPDGEGYEEEHPRHQVWLDAFYMDKFEVTVARYAEFMQVKDRPQPAYWFYYEVSKYRNLPVVGVNWHEADAYCRWAGKRLPTEAEWEKAARGTDQRVYPWGDVAPDKTRANFGKDRFVKDLRVVLTDVGSFETGKSPYEAYDMAGNAWEWVADWHDGNYYGKSPARNPKGPASGKYKALRGGGWSHDPHNLRSTERYQNEPTLQTRLIGFRCAQDVPK